MNPYLQQLQQMRGLPREQQQWGMQHMLQTSAPQIMDSIASDYQMAQTPNTYQRPGPTMQSTSPWVTAIGGR